MHLHLGFDATGLEDLELHHIIVNSWEGGVDTEQVCTRQATHFYVTIISMASTCLADTLRGSTQVFTVCLPPLGGVIPV